MGTFPISTLPFSELLHAYQQEADGLATIAQLTHQSSTKLISKLSRSTGIIDTSSNSPILRYIFYSAHIAACCELFNGSIIPAQYLTLANISTWVEEILGPYKNADDEQIEKISSKLQCL